MIRALAWLASAGLAALVVAGAWPTDEALTAGNVVGSARLGSSARAISVDDKKPAACSGITLTNLVIGGNGSNAPDLVLGSAGPDTLAGKVGNDCIVGGAGDDTINGGPGTDVCIGGPGTDTFSNCETAIP
jgi:Ca2+-binding RTX toxin-like protein